MDKMIVLKITNCTGRPKPKGFINIGNNTQEL